MTRDLWYCADCLNIGPLCSHGRCSFCGSNGVGPARVILQRRKPGEIFTDFVLRLLEVL